MCRQTSLWVIAVAVLFTLASAAACGGKTAVGVAEEGTDASPPDDTGAAADGSEAGTSLSHCPVAPAVQGGILARVLWADGVAFCIDSTEVTNAQYAAFLAAGVSPSTQGPRCAWNQTFTPETKSTNGPACPVFGGTDRADYPVVCIDWCDADAYCRWSGKHLCQKPGGGTVQAITGKNASEWVIACTGDGAGSYPYGGAAVAGRCVDRQYPGPTPTLRPVKEASTCEGGVPGLFDMSGNAWEWNDDCAGTAGDGSGDTCSPLGGAFSTDPSGASCTGVAPFLRKQVAGDTGFRCCVDADFF